MYKRQQPSLNSSPQSLPRRKSRRVSRLTMRATPTPATCYTTRQPTSSSSCLLYTSHGEIKDADINPLRNKRDVWKINTVPFKGGHYAAYPPKLVETCLLAGCPEGGIVLDLSLIHISPSSRVLHLIGDKTAHGGRRCRSDRPSAYPSAVRAVQLNVTRCPFFQKRS